MTDGQNKSDDDSRWIDQHVNIFRCWSGELFDILVTMVNVQKRFGKVRHEFVIREGPFQQRRTVAQFINYHYQLVNIFIE